MKMAKLKPCPYCGHPKSRLLFKREYCEDMKGRVAVRDRICRACNKCGARGGHVFTDPQERDGGIDRYVDGEPDGSIPTWHVYCGYCGAMGPEAMLKRENAVSAWNRRDGERDE